MSFFLSPIPLIKRKQFYFLTIVSTLFFPSGIINSFAQVNINNSALNSLGPAKKNTPPKQKKEKKITSHKKNVKHNSIKNTQTLSKKNKITTDSLPTIPNSPPPNPVFKDPELNIPLHPPSPPPMPKINPAAQGDVVVTNKHIIINFVGDNSDLNETMMKAIMNFANNLKQHPQNQVYLNAYSHGTADDISTPRRNALNRGLAIRAVLINQGIPTTRIYLIAKGIPETNINKNHDYVEIIRSDLIN